MITEAIIIGIIAWVFVIILVDEGMIFSWWWDVINGLPQWLKSPLGACEYCVAGQMSLWYYLFAHWHDYNVFYHIAYISISIFTVRIINDLEQYKWS